MIYLVKIWFIFDPFGGEDATELGWVPLSHADCSVKRDREGVSGQESLDPPPGEDNGELGVSGAGAFIPGQEF